MTLFKQMIACGAVTLCGFASVSPAAPIVYEGFGYRAGGLSSTSGGTGFANQWDGGTASGPAGGLTYGQLQVTPGDATTPSSTQWSIASRALDSGVSLGGNSGEVWISFLMKLGNTSSGYAGIGIGNSDQRLQIGQFSSGSGSAWGVGTVSNNSSKVVFASTVDTNAHLFVVKASLVAGADTVQLWVDPSLDTLPTASSAGYLGKATSLNVGNDKKWTQLQIMSGEWRTARIDEIRVGANFASVTPVPEPSMVLAIALPVFGLAARCRRTAR